MFSIHVADGRNVHYSWVLGRYFRILFNYYAPAAASRMDDVLDLLSR